MAKPGPGKKEKKERMTITQMFSYDCCYCCMLPRWVAEKKSLEIYLSALTVGKRKSHSASPCTHNKHHSLGKIQCWAKRWKKPLSLRLGLKFFPNRLFLSLSLSLSLTVFPASCHEKREKEKGERFLEKCFTFDPVTYIDRATCVFFCLFF